ncbi:hypothetical protein VPMS16_1686 [Vibrio sp. 16]|nr:hypothetical protein VPMS16_1686 [Vibrio sp. 16]
MTYIVLRTFYDQVHTLNPTNIRKSTKIKNRTKHQKDDI